MENTWFKPERVFLILSLFWGLLYLFVSPPFTAADECCHFWKIYLLSEGKLSAKKLTSPVANGIIRDRVLSMTGEYVPFGMYKAGYKNIRTRWRDFEKTSFSQTKEILSYSLEKDKLVFNTFPVPVYTIFSYLPSVVLMKIMTLANINPGIMMYVLRLVSLITYTALIYAAIKIIPFKKWLFAALGLLPAAVYQASMINTDGITIGTGFLFIALTFYYAYGENVKVLSKKNLFIYLAVGLWFLICKFAYAPVLLIYFLIPKENFISSTDSDGLLNLCNKQVQHLTTSPAQSTSAWGHFRKMLDSAPLTLRRPLLQARSHSDFFESQKLRYKAFAWAVTILFLFVMLLFYINSRITAYTDDVYMRQTAFAFLIEKPIIFIKAAFYTLLVKGKDCLTGVIGSFGWGEVKIPLHIAGIYYLSLLLFSVFNFKEEQMQKTPETVHKLLFAGIFILYSILLFVILYLNFQISKDGIIDGFWGRYFIPVLPFIFLCFQNKKFFVKTNALIFVNLVLINFVLFVSLIRIVYRFYV